MLKLKLALFVLVVLVLFVVGLYQHIAAHVKKWTKKGDGDV